MNPADLARAAAWGPGDVDEQVAEILAETPADLAEETDQLTRAHAVLHRALQDNG